MTIEKVQRQVKLYEPFSDAECSCIWTTFDWAAFIAATPWATVHPDYCLRSTRRAQASLRHVSRTESGNAVELKVATALILQVVLREVAGVEGITDPFSVNDFAVA